MRGASYCCPFLTKKSGVCRHNSVKLLGIRFRGNSFSRSRVVTCVQTVEHSDLIGSAKEFERSMKGYVYLFMAYLTTPLIAQTIWHQ